MNFNDTLARSVRGLLRKPAFLTAAVASLSLAVAIAMVVSTLFQAVALTPLPLSDAKRLVVLKEFDRLRPDTFQDSSPLNLLDWQKRQRSFTVVAAAEPGGLDTNALTGRPETFRAWMVTEGFFDAMGVTPHLGRLFVGSDFHDVTGSVVILSEPFWCSHFSADREVVGRTLSFLNGPPRTIVGVLPKGLAFPEEKPFYTPRVFGEDDLRSRGANYISVVARLRPGVTAEQAQVDMERISAEMQTEFPATQKGRAIRVRSVNDEVAGVAGSMLRSFVGVAILLLLMAGANVAVLLLVRQLSGEQVLLIRRALGATDADLTRLVAIDAGVVVAVALLVGTALAEGTLRFAQAAIATLPRVQSASVDVPAALAVGLTTLLVIVGCSLAATRSTMGRGRALSSSMRGSVGSSVPRATVRALIAVQVAVAMAFCGAAIALSRSYREVGRIDQGFDASDVTALLVYFWETQTIGEKRVEFVRQIEDALSAVPGVKAVGSSSMLPLLAEAMDVRAKVTWPGSGQAESVLMAYSTVSTRGYFQALAIRLKRGRLFESVDVAHSRPVVIVNEALAGRVFGDEDPLGKEIIVGSFGRAKPREVVGVVGNVRNFGPERSAEPEYFVPHAQSPIGSMTFLVRAPGVPIDGLKRAVWTIDPQQPLYRVARMEDVAARAAAPRSLILQCLGGFAGLAALMAALGISGLSALLVSRREKDLAIRRSLGAGGLHVVLAALRDATIGLVCGGIAGAAGAMALTYALRSQLVGVSIVDASTLGLTGLLLAFVTAVVCSRPARRALRVDPALSLRAE